MSQKLGWLLVIFIVATLAVYILRGIGFLTLMPGGVIWLLLLFTVLTGLLYNFARIKRY